MSDKALPIFSSSISAGFPSAADDHIDKHLDLNELLIPHPAATFFTRVQGDSMKEAGIFSGDLLIVDRAKTAVSGSVIVALYQGEFTVKRLIKEKNRLFLEPANPAYRKIAIEEKDEFQVWGVVTYAIHPLQTPCQKN